MIRSELVQYLFSQFQALDSENNVNFDPIIRPILPAGTSIVFSVKEFSLFLNVMAQMDKNILKDLQVSQAQSSGCVASSFPVATVDEFSLAVSNATLVINDGKVSRDMTKSINKILDFVTSPRKIAKMNANIATKLANANDVCINSHVVPDASDDAIAQVVDNAEPWTWQIALLVGGCIGSLVLLLWVYYYWGRSGKIRCKIGSTKNEWSAVSDNDINEQFLLDDEDDRSWWDRWGCDDALICQVKLPLAFRIGIFCALIGNMGLFLNSNLLVDAVSVVMEIDIGNKVIQPDPIFNFGLASTVQDSKKPIFFLLHYLCF